MCVCNGLLATVGLGQTHPSAYEEPPLITAGADVTAIAGFLAPGHDRYTAADVIQRLLDGDAPQQPG